MSKRAVILHGTDCSPDSNWLPWAKHQLESRGYDVWVPELPGNHTPNRFVYDGFLRESGWDFTDNVLIGHSSGATNILNLLAADWFPTVEKAILVGTFLNEDKLHANRPDWYEDGQFDQLFPVVFDVDTIKAKAREFIFIHGVDDPYCAYDDTVAFCKAVGGTLKSVVDGRHLSSNRKELPELLPYIEDGESHK